MKSTFFGCATAVAALALTSPAIADGRAGSGQVRTNQAPAQAQPANPSQSSHTKGRARGINTVPPRPQPQANQAAGGVTVASGDVTGDGRADTALLLPAIQKVKAAGATGSQAPASSQPKPKPKPKPSTGSTDRKSPPPESVSFN